MKKKIVAMCATVALAAVAIAGGSLAYFTDTDSKENVFTVGNVDIALEEIFDQNAKLLPGTSTENFVEKVVNVKNTGSENAYVRVHIAVPSALVDQDLNSYNDMLHWNFKADAYGAGKWSMLPEYSAEDGWADNGRANQNVYNTTINGVDHTVWVVTYRTALASGATTDGAAMTKMYLDWRTDTADGKTYVKSNYDAQGNAVAGKMTYVTENGQIAVQVYAEGTQTSAGFENAYDALNTAFGVPSNSSNPWNNYGKA